MALFQYNVSLGMVPIHCISKIDHLLPGISIQMFLLFVYAVPVPSVVALILSRSYLRERTCNAGMKLSRCSLRNLSLYLIADENAVFLSLFEKNIFLFKLPVFV